MNISYANAHKWTKPVVNDPLTLFGENDQARLRSSLRIIETSPVRIEIRELDESFLDTFVPLYRRRILEKCNPMIFNVREKTLENSGARRYSALSLYEGEQFLGGMIFRVAGCTLSIAYRMFEKRWGRVGLRAKPSLYAEYELARYARDIGMSAIIHGKDRNPYGAHSDIGLAAFKLSVGCTPFKSKNYEVKTLDTETLSSDALIFVYPGENAERITRAILVTTKENESFWHSVTQYPERLIVETQYRAV